MNKLQTYLQLIAYGWEHLMDFRHLENANRALQNLWGKSDQYEYTIGGAKGPGFDYALYRRRGWLTSITITPSVYFPSFDNFQKELTMNYKPKPTPTTVKVPPNAVAIRKVNGPYQA